MKKKQITAAIPAVLLVLGLVLAGCPQSSGGGGGDPITPSTSYTVTFNSNGGSSTPDTQKVTSGGKVTEPAPGSVTKTGYQLAGWYKEPALVNRWDFATDTVSANITLYAKWVQPQTSVSEIASYIDAEAAAGRGTSASNPISIIASGINLGSNWQNLLSTINIKGKFVELDLALCTMSGSEFDPYNAVSSGEDRIVRLVLPDAAERIAAGTYSDPSFKHFTGLKSVAGAHIEAIGDYAFYEKAGLTSVSFPAATSIGDSAFYYCTGLSSVSFPAATSIGDYTFYYCTGLSSVSFPEATSIGDNAFNSCHALSSASFPKATSIGTGAFGGCYGLTSVSIPKATSIGAGAFNSCTRLTSISFPKSATLGTNPFAVCTSLSSFDLTGAGDLSVIEGSKALIRNNTELIAYPTASGTITIGSITSIGNDAFSACYDLTSASFPDVDTIGDYAFAHCAGLTTLNIPSVTSIGDRVLMATETDNLTITMGENAPTVGSDSFFVVSSTKNVTVKVPSGATGYGSLPDNYTSSDNTDNWGNGFRGGGWDGSFMSTSTVSTTNGINPNINLDVVALP